MKLIIANKNYSSWSLRPWILLRALDIPFEEELVQFDGLDNYKQFRSFAPGGTVPCLIDGEHTVWDSLAIALYLADRHESVWPREAEARMWAQCVVCEMHSGFAALRHDCPMNVGVRVNSWPMRVLLQRDVARVREIFEQGLERFGGPFLAGKSFTAADAFFAPVCYRVRTYGLEMGPLGAKWVEMMLEHPAMQEWEAAALLEPYREKGHEAELAAAGVVTRDYRLVPA